MGEPETGAEPAGWVERWNRFWYAEGSPASLGVFRALFAVCLLLELPVTRSYHVFAIQGGFHLPYLPFSWLVSLETYQLLHEIQYPFIFLLGVGLLPRISAAVLFAVQGFIFFADQLNFRNHPYLFLLLLLLLAFAPSGQAFSITALARRTLGGIRNGAAWVAPMAPLTVHRLIQVEISIVYFYAALHKMTGQFLGGWVMADVVGGALAKGPFGRHLSALLSPESFQAVSDAAARPGFWMPFAWMTVILEVLLPRGPLASPVASSGPRLWRRVPSRHRLFDGHPGVLAGDDLVVPAVP